MNTIIKKCACTYVRTYVNTTTCISIYMNMLYVLCVCVCACVRACVMMYYSPASTALTSLSTASGLNNGLMKNWENLRKYVCNCKNELYSTFKPTALCMYVCTSKI